MTGARLSRLGGALLLHAQGAFFLIGNLKRPCDFGAAGFVAPAQPIDALAQPVLPLAPAPGQTPSETGPFLDVTVATPPDTTAPTAAGEALARRLAACLLIERNGSVSDRLWRLLLGDDSDPDAEAPAPTAVVDARWLPTLPPHIWNVVRDTVLKCS